MTVMKFADNFVSLFQRFYTLKFISSLKPAISNILWILKLFVMSGF